MTRLKWIEPDIGIAIRSPGAGPAIGLVGADIFTHPATTAASTATAAAGGFGLAAFAFAGFAAFSAIFVVTFGAVAFSVGFGRGRAIRGLVTTASTTATATTTATRFTVITSLFGALGRTARCRPGRGF